MSESGKITELRDGAEPSRDATTERTITEAERTLRLENAELRLQLAEAERSLREYRARWAEHVSTGDNESGESLQERVARLRAVLDAASAGAWEWNLETGVVEWSVLNYHIYDVDPASGPVSYSVWESRLHPDDRERVNRAVRRVLDGDAPSFREEFRVMKRSGGVRWLLGIGRVERRADGFARRMSGLNFEITDRKAAEVVHEGNAALFSALVEQAPDGVYVVDGHFRIREVNARARPVFATVDPLIGRDLDEVMRILWGQDLGKEIARIFRHTLETGERYVSPPFSHWRHDLNEEQSYEWETQRLTLPDNTLGVVCYFREVTERARTEKALRESEERMRLATEATGVGIWEWSIEKNVVWWDAQMFRIYGVEPTRDGYVPYRTWSEAVHPDELAREEAILQGMIAHREGDNRREFRIRRADTGEWRHIRSVEVVRLDSTGKPYCIVGTNLDVTERKRAEDALIVARQCAEAANASKDRFLAMLSHELRTPLTPVLMMASAYRRDPKLSAELREDFDMIVRNISLEGRLIDDLLDLSRVVNGKFNLEPQRCDVHLLLRLVARMAEADAAEKQIKVTLDLGAKEHELTGDPERLQQVFWNLLRNAVKFTPPHGYVHVRTFEQADQIAVEVCDTGAGFEPEAATQIFEPFGQTNAGKRSGGLGLGLAIARAIVELHEGEICAKSDGPGTGAVFTVTLPLGTLL